MLDFCLALRTLGSGAPSCVPTHPHNIAPPLPRRAASLQALSCTGFSESSPAGEFWPLQGSLSRTLNSAPVSYQQPVCYSSVLNGLCLSGSLSCLLCPADGCLRFRARMQIRRSHSNSLFKDFTVCQVLFSALHVCSVI